MGLPVEARTGVIVKIVWEFGESDYFAIPLTEERVWDDGKSDVSLLLNSSENINITRRQINKMFR